jgi:hypothetical protein
MVNALIMQEPLLILGFNLNIVMKKIKLLFNCHLIQHHHVDYVVRDNIKILMEIVNIVLMVFISLWIIMILLIILFLHSVLNAVQDHLLKSNLNLKSLRIFHLGLSRIVQI